MSEETVKDLPLLKEKKTLFKTVGLLRIQLSFMPQSLVNSVVLKR